MTTSASSIDGIQETHDRFRRLDGAYEASMKAHPPVSCTRHQGRHALYHDPGQRARVAALLDLMETEGIDKFYLSHLNYAGRGNINRKDDVILKTTRWAMDLLFRPLLGLYAARTA